MSKGVIFSLICLTLCAMSNFGTSINAESDAKLKVAVLTHMQSVSENCLQATLKILNANGISAKAIPGRLIRNGALKDYDIIMLPGGSGSGQARALGEDGCAAVEEFVRNGGGFIGTCAGGYLAAKGYSVTGDDTSASSWLELVNAEIVDADHWNRGQGKVEIKILDSTHPILEGFSGTFEAQYVNGPLFKPGNDPKLSPYQELAVFKSDMHSSGGAAAGVMPGTPALLTSTYGEGRCVLFSYHPELTPGLEMMLVQAVRWVKGL